MGIRGTLTREKLNFSMPSDAEMYPAPPYDYPAATMIVVEFETDPATAAALVPAQAELDDPPVAGLVFADYPTSSIGPYGEVIVYLKATYDSHPVQYAARFFVTTDTAMAAGREQAGIPKKIGAIEFRVDPNVAIAQGQEFPCSLERPAGTPIVAATFRVGNRLPVPAGTTEPFDYLSLRVIPSPTLGAAPSLCELVETKWSLVIAEVWEVDTPEPITFGAATTHDSFEAVPIRKILRQSLIRGEMHVAANKTPLISPF